MICFCPQLFARATKTACVACRVSKMLLARRARVPWADQKARTAAPIQQFRPQRELLAPGNQRWTQLRRCCLLPPPLISKANSRTGRLWFYPVGAFCCFDNQLPPLWNVLYVAIKRQPQRRPFVYMKSHIEAATLFEYRILERVECYPLKGSSLQ